MSRLPQLPFGNKSASNTPVPSPAPKLKAGPEVLVDDTVSPQLAKTVEGISHAVKQSPDRSIPRPPELTTLGPAAAQNAPEAPKKELPPSLPPRLPNPAQSLPEPPKPQEKPMTPTPNVPSIENLHKDKATQLEEQKDLQKRQMAAINRLPQNLKMSINRLFEHITDDTSSEVTLNGPNAVGFKRAGQRFIDRDIDFGDTETYHAVLNDFLLPQTNTFKRIGEDPYLIEGKLVIPDLSNPSRPPLMARVHIIAPPAVPNALVTIAKKSRTQLTIDAMVNSGSMTSDMGSFLKNLARGRATIVFSGVSGSGKTTVLEALSREFDLSDRIILVEDTEELSFESPQVTHLLSHQTRPGEDPRNSVSLEWLVRQANRMRPDRIVVGEIRGAEMSEFLTAANSGADGSMTTVHANSPQQAIAKMLSLASKDDNAKSESSILRDIASTVQVIVQLSIIDGKYKVSQIEEVSSTINKNTMGIQTATIFRYNRNTGRFDYENRISDGFSDFLKQRGVEIAPPTNFMTPRY